MLIARPISILAQGLNTAESTVDTGIFEKCIQPWSQNCAWPFLVGEVICCFMLADVRCSSWSQMSSPTLLPSVHVRSMSPIRKDDMHDYSSHSNVAAQRLATAQGPQSRERDGQCQELLVSGSLRWRWWKPCRARQARHGEVYLARKAK